MRLQLRETGSILVPADREEVLDVLQRVVRHGARVGADRVESAGSTYVVQQRAEGTRVVHMRSSSSAVPTAALEREELRRAVQADLFQLQQVFQVKSR